MKKTLFTCLVLLTGSLIAPHSMHAQGSTSSAPQIRLTTNKAIGESITLYLKIADQDKKDLWIDLNNDGVKQDNEAVANIDAGVQCPLGSPTIVIYGKVQSLDCAEVGISEISVHNGTLDYLACGQNDLLKLDVANAPALAKLWCEGNQLMELDLSKNPELKQLVCYGNALEELKLSANTKLEKLNCMSNSISSLDLKKQTNLKELACNDNTINQIELGKKPELKVLSCGINKLESLDLSTAPALEKLSCQTNKLKALDLKEGKALKLLNCSGNQIDKLDLSACRNLNYLDCSTNRLEALDLTANQALTKIYAFFNKLPEAETLKITQALPAQTEQAKGILAIIAINDDKEQNICNKTSVATAQKAHWDVQAFDAKTFDFVAYEGSLDTHVASVVEGGFAVYQTPLGWIVRGISRDTSVEIYDTAGRLVAKAHIADAEELIPLDLPAGNYVVYASNGHERHTTKITITR